MPTLAPASHNKVQYDENNQDNDQNDGQCR